MSFFCYDFLLVLPMFVHLLVVLKKNLAMGFFLYFVFGIEIEDFLSCCKKRVFKKNHI